MAGSWAVATTLRWGNSWPAAALQCLESSTWDLLITDIELPGMSGLELIERVAALAPGLPVAVLAGNATVDRVVTALRFSAAEFLQKPIAPQELMDRATALVEAGWQARAAGRETVPASGPIPTTWRSAPPGR